MQAKSPCPRPGCGTLKKRSWSVVPLVLLLSAVVGGKSAVAQVPGTLFTYAGGPVVHEGGSANQPVTNVSDIAVDDSGNLYFADGIKQIVYKLSPGGQITRVAGNGLGHGTVGDQLALDYAFIYPDGLAVDHDGNLYIADMIASQILKVTPDGNCSVIAGQFNQFGDSGDGGPATQALLNWPSRMAFDDAGNLYVTEIRSRSLRKISPAGIITTVAGNGSMEFSGEGGPATQAGLVIQDVAVDEAGNLFLADPYNERILKVAPNGTLTTVAGSGYRDPQTGLGGYSGDGGPATDARFNYAHSVAVDGAGNLYIGDCYNQRIRKVDTNGIVTTIAGTGQQGDTGDGGPATQATLAMVGPIKRDSAGNIYLVEGDRIRVVDSSGIIHTKIGVTQTEGVPVSQESLSGFMSIAHDAAGNLFISDSEHNRILKVDSNGIAVTFAGTGVAGYSGDNGPAAQAQLSGPGNIALDGAGNLYMSDFSNRRIRKIDTSGVITTVAGSGASGFDGGYQFSPDGTAALSAQFGFIQGLRIGPDGAIYFTESDVHRVRKIGADGLLATVAGTGTLNGGDPWSAGGFSGDGGPATQAQMNQPGEIAFDDQGNLYISDRLNYRVRKVDANGIITTVAGNGNDAGSSGDGQPAVNVSLGGTGGLAFDADGNLYIGSASRVSKVRADGTLTFIAGTGGGDRTAETGPALKVKIGGGGSISFDRSGNLLFTDHYQGDSFIREIVGASSLFTGTTGPLAGDLNGDGKVSLGDVVLALQFAIGNGTPTAAQSKAADMNKDGAFNLRDVTLLLQKVVGSS